MTATDLVWIPAQTTILGSDTHYPEEAPAREVSTAGFWIQRHQVTNADYAEFVHATGYVTVAERPVNPDDFPARHRRIWCLVRWCSSAPPARWTCATSASGGHGRLARAGIIPVDQGRH